MFNGFIPKYFQTLLLADLNGHTVFKFG